jgi:hypothetical protein
MKAGSPQQTPRSVPEPLELPIAVAAGGDIDLLGHVNDVVDLGWVQSHTGE